MKASRTFLLLICFILLSIVIAAAQSDECPPIIEAALSEIDQLCINTARNQACYGHVSMSAEAQPDAANFTFDQIGDIVNVSAIKSLKLGALDTNAGVWGVALMRLQANIPDTLPGQNVTFLLFGDTEIRNSANSVAEQEGGATLEVLVNGTNSVNVRVGPGQQAAILTTAAPGAKLTATGRNADSSWIRITLPDDSGRSGWIFADLLTTSGDANTLSNVEGGQTTFGPMQAFYLNTGIGEAACKGVPQDGLLVQTPKGVGSVNFVVNEVQIQMGSTVFFQAQPGDRMTIRTLEGAARANVDGSESTAVAGTEIDIPIDEDLEPSGEPSDPESYEIDDIADIPIDVLERDIEIADPLDEESLDTLLAFDEIINFADLDDLDDIRGYLSEEEEIDLLKFLVTELDYELDDFYDDEAVITFFEEEYDYRIGEEFSFGIDEDGDGFDLVLDCDDQDASIFPGAEEIEGDGIDQNCDGLDINTDFYGVGEDNDGDGFGSDWDCDDNNDRIYPLADEIDGDGIDQNCDGSDYAPIDADGDGFDSVFDCDDSDPNVNFLAEEIEGDGIDQNCDGLDRTILDNDGDGWDENTDCNDADNRIYPFAPETNGDGVDSDCDGQDSVAVDNDGDGWDETVDCNDFDNRIYPFAPETNGDGVDSDCDGQDSLAIDNDGDGWDETVDCNDFDNRIYPFAPETNGDGIDSDCDGQDSLAIDNDGDGWDETLDCDDFNDRIYPFAPETASDGIDSNCDGFDD